MCCVDLLITNRVTVCVCNSKDKLMGNRCKCLIYYSGTKYSVI